uniref:DUF4806 domain-containing protein n=1 Tax=Daphnia galeata TaxID=27404 RepID=A0A8J2RSI9_9CRUS|nr:unnamed protein product [Daphnia galeata]
MKFVTISKNDDDALYLPDKSYSLAYKTTILKCGAPPDLENWDRYDIFKILIFIYFLGTYDEARINLPRVEAGLPILDDSNTGRGQREKKRKRLSLPGESTTEVDSEEDFENQSTSKAGVRKKPSHKRSPKKPSIAKPTNRPTLPKPPDGLSVTKGKTLKEVQRKEICKEKGSNTQQLKPEGASCNVHLTNQPPTQPEGTMCLLNNTSEDSYGTQDSYGTNSFENSQPVHHNAAANYNWGMPQYWNGNYHPQMNPRCSFPPPPIQSPSSVRFEPGSQHIVADSNGGSSSSAEYSSHYYPTPTPSPSPVLGQSTNSGSLQQIDRQPANKTNHPIMPDIEDPLGGIPEKSSVKGASGNAYFLSALVKINEKLNVIGKTIKPVSDNEAEELDENMDCLPLTSLEQLHSFEKVLKQDKNIYNKLVSRIRLLGKKNAKNSEADYVRRGWNTVFAHSLAKDVNWFGRKDARVNNGAGKTGIVKLAISKAVEVGIRSNKNVGGMEYESLVRHTQLHLRNAKTRFCSEQAKDDNDDDS